MKVLIAAVADHAWVESGCLSLCRTFDTINAPKFPFTMPRLSIALRVLIRRSEAGEHKLKITMADDDGKKVMNAELNLNFQPPEESVPEASVPFVLNGQNIVFQKAGDYVVDFVIDGDVKASVPLYVRQGAIPREDESRYRSPTGS